MFGVWNVYFGWIGLNLGVLFLGLFVLALAFVKKLMGKQTCFFEVSYLLFLVSLLYFTLHGRLLQLIFRISLPEKPLVDSNLTLNYALTSLLTFMVFPVLLLTVIKSDVSLKKLGLRVPNLKQTIVYAAFGLFLTVSIFLITNTFFGFRWISEYSFDGLVLWILLVTILSVFAQAFFFQGVLFNKYLGSGNDFLLALVSISALQLFTVASLPWIIANIVGSAVKIMVTWKTRNIYGAALMGIITNLIDILIQVA